MSAHESPLVSIVIVTHNSMRTLEACLDSVSTHGPSGPGDVWVVDNASTDGTADWVEKNRPDVRLARNAGNAGFGAGNNRALREAEGEYALLLNPDALLTPGAADALLDYVRERPAVAAAGPRVVHPDGSLQRTAYTFPTVAQLFFDNFFLADLWPGNPVTGPFKHWNHDTTRPVPWLVGACLMVRRAAVLEAGGFDEGFFLFAEETDLCRRLWDRGYEVHFFPGATVIHEEKTSFSTPVAASVRNYEGIRAYFRKHGSPSARGAVHGIQLAGAALRAAVLTAAAPWSARRRAQWAYYLRKTGWYLGVYRPRV